MNHRVLKAAAIALALGFGPVAVPAEAHHSTAMFDKSKTVTVTGTVKSFQWSNPHAVIWITADAAKGEEQKLWAVELTSPGVLTRNGWTKHSFEPGDKVVVDVGPLRDGKPGGYFKKATFTDTGKVLIFLLQPQDGPGSN